MQRMCNFAAAMEFSAVQIAQLLGGRVEGNLEVVVRRFSKIEEATPDCLSFVANAKYEFIRTPPRQRWCWSMSCRC